MPVSKIQRRFPAEALGRLEVILKNGKMLRSELTAARGYAHIPLSDEEIHDKFRRLAGPALRERTESVIEAVMGIEDSANADRLLKLVGALGACRRD